ncbi:sensor histidine kinase [uncultured Pseudoteredinibacter sp.]|uniref:sensor histidine kinase n=1 Tax=uncultured Pseudoteredinibacter sp. TaxID=1641701 RepID=UPI002606DB45|nr:sensor histidine kinase [uncultured Pseudoteredinibacter sp.]
MVLYALLLASSALSTTIKKERYHIKDERHYDELFNKAQLLVQSLPSQSASITAYSIAETNDGRIWIATSLGLYWLDGLGKNDAVDSLGNSLNSNTPSLKIIKADKNHGLWIYHENKVLQYYHSKERWLKTYNTEENLEITSIDVDEANNLLIASNKGLYYTNALKDNIQPHPLSASNKAIETIHIKDNRVYFQEGNNIVALNLNNSKATLETKGRLNHIASSVLIDKEDNIWITAKSKGLYKIDNNGKTHNINITANFTKVVQTKDKKIWASTQSTGIHIYDPNSHNLSNTINYNPKQKTSLTLSSIYDMYLDSNELLWISGSPHSINYINTRNKAYRNILHNTENNNALLSNSIYYILESSDKRIWVAYSDAGIGVTDKKGEIIASYKDQLSAPGVYALAEDNNGDIWAVVGSGSLNKIDPKSHTVDTKIHNKNPNHGKLFNIIFDEEERLFTSGNKGIFLYDKETKTLRSIDILSSKKPSSIKTAHSFMDTSGNLWFAGRQYMAVIPKGASDAILAWPPENTVSQDNTPLRWAFPSSRNGAYAIIGKVLHKLTIDKKTKEIDISKIPTDDTISGRFYEIDGKLMASHRHVDLSTGKVKLLNESDGIIPKIDRYYASEKLSDGTLLHGSSEGLILFRPWLQQEWTHTPSVQIKKITVADKEQTAPYSEITIPAKQNRITFYSSVLDYSYPSLNRHAHRLLGYSDKWIEQGSEGQRVSYTNLDPGEYTMEFKGSGKNGKWSNKINQVKIKVLPDWFETLWFRSMLAIAFIIAMLIIYRWRTRHLHARQILLENQVEDRTKELSKSLIQLKQAQNQLIESEKHASLGRLVRGISHELNTPIGIVKTASSGLIDNSKAIYNNFLQGSLSPDSLKAYLEKMINSGDLIESNIDRMSAINQSFKASSSDEYSHKASDVNIRDLIDKIILYVQAHLDEKNISTKITIDESLNIRTNAEALQNVLKELLTNCIDHGFGEKSDTNLITIKTSRWKNIGIKILIVDNGKGMNEETKSEVFEPFYTTSPSPHHSGLGLHSVFNWVTQILRGQISCRSKLGSGTCFILLLKNL